MTEMTEFLRNNNESAKNNPQDHSEGLTASSSLHNDAYSRDSIKQTLDAASGDVKRQTSAMFMMDAIESDGDKRESNLTAARICSEPMSELLANNEIVKRYDKYTEEKHSAEAFTATAAMTLLNNYLLQDMPAPARALASLGVSYAAGSILDNKLAGHDALDLYGFRDNAYMTGVFAASAVIIGGISRDVSVLAENALSKAFVPAVIDSGIKIVGAHSAKEKLESFQDAWEKSKQDAANYLGKK